MNHPTIYFVSCSKCNREGQYKWPGYCNECGQQHDHSFHLSDHEYANLPQDTLWVHVDRLDGNGWTYQTNHHRLGDALFTAQRDGRQSRYLSSFDYNENPPLYFLCEVPRSVHPTVQ